MSTYWNYRLIFNDTDPDPENHFIGLHEVYWDRTDGRLRSWALNPATILCAVDEGADGIISGLEKALVGARKPILRLSELEAKKIQDDRTAS